jgi:uncharacterized protein (TIGR01777 family)
MKRIVVSGGSGYIGSALVSHLVSRGDRVTVLTRGEAAEGNPRRVTWNPYRAGPWAQALDGVDAVVHLAGERAVGARYTEEVKRRIYDSRIVTTREVVSAMARVAVRPHVFVSASAVGYYGDRPASAPVDETSPPGDDFLARLCVDWEAESEQARALGVRVVNPRIGIVFGPGDGPLKVMAMPFRFFVGGKLGSGEQGISWIYLDDAVSALVRCVDDDDMPAKVNVCSPHPTSNADISASIAQVLGRPNLLTVPKFGLRAIFGEGAQTILTGQYAVPKRLGSLGFTFQTPQLLDALRRGLA